jgi:hypothetical protein
MHMLEVDGSGTLPEAGEVAGMPWEDMVVFGVTDHAILEAAWKRREEAIARVIKAFEAGDYEEVDISESE